MRRKVSLGQGQSALVAVLVIGGLLHGVRADTGGFESVADEMDAPLGAGGTA